MHKTAWWISLFVLMFSPLAFGAVEPWSLALMEGLVVLAAFLLFLGKALERESPLYEVPGIVPLGILWAFILFQLVPLPSFFVKVISPGTYDLYMETGGAVAPSSWFPLSLYPKGTLVELFLCAHRAALDRGQGAQECGLRSIGLCDISFIHKHNTALRLA
jgi:hypothetical protein